MRAAIYARITGQPEGRLIRFGQIPGAVSSA
jgi:hypothetical protein